MQAPPAASKTLSSAEVVRPRAVLSTIAYYREFVQLKRHCGIDVGDSAGLEGGFGWNVASTALAIVRSCWRRYAESLLLQIRPPAPSGRRRSTGT